MNRHPRLGRVHRLALATVVALLPACFGGGGDDGGSVPSGPPTAFIWIDQYVSKVDTGSIELRGEAECDGCPPPSDWQLYSCPVLDCPATTLAVSWTNHASGASGATTHWIGSACYCPPFAYNYCYSACKHIWWATVPLTFGHNAIDVTAAGPGYATGTETADVQRAPLAPAWTLVQPGGGEMTLGWSAVEGATSYNLYWSTTQYGWSSLCEKIPDVTAPYTHTGLQGGVTYYYYVTALAGNVESFDSPQLAATPN